MVAVNVLWHTIFARLSHHLFELQEAGGCTISMHTGTGFIKCIFVGAKEYVDVFCVYGSCGTKRGMQRWLSAKSETIQGLPTLGLKSRAQFKSCAASPKSLKKATENTLLNQPLTLTQILPLLALYLLLRGRIVQPHFRGLMYLPWKNVFSLHETLS